MKKGIKANAQMGLDEAIRRADQIIQSAHIRQDDQEFEWIESYLIWYRLFIPGVFDFDEVETRDLRGEYLVIGADQERVYVWDPYEDRVYAFRGRHTFVGRNVYIYRGGTYSVSVESAVYKKYGKGMFLPFVWVHILRDLFAGRDTYYSLHSKLRNINVDIYGMMSLSSRYRKGREKKNIENMFEGHFERVEQDFVYGRVFEAFPRSLDAVYLLLGVDLNGNSVRMLFGEVLPHELAYRSDFQPSYFVFRTEEVFIVRTGMIWLEEQDFWHVLSHEYRPVILVYDRVWGAIFVEVSFPPSYFWRTVIHSHNEEGNPQHVTWYVPRKYWRLVLQTVHVK
jgi:hypothetical protein